MKTTINPLSADFGSLLLAIIASIGILTVAVMDAYAQLKGLPRIAVDPDVSAGALAVVAHYFGRATKGITVQGKEYSDPLSASDPKATVTASPAVSPEAPAETPQFDPAGNPVEGEVSPTVAP